MAGQAGSGAEVHPGALLILSREEQDLVRTYALGVNAYVVKPMVFSDFIDAVKALGQFWVVVNEPLQHER